MKKQKSIYDGNKKIMEDEASYEDKNTIALIDLIVDIVVTKTIEQAEALEDKRTKSGSSTGNDG